MQTVDLVVSTTRGAGCPVAQYQQSPAFYCRNPSLEQPVHYKYCSVGLESVLVFEKLA